MNTGVWGLGLGLGLGLRLGLGSGSGVGGTGRGPLTLIEHSGALSGSAISEQKKKDVCVRIVLVGYEYFGPNNF